MDVLQRLPGDKEGLAKSSFVSQAEEFAVFWILIGANGPALLGQLIKVWEAMFLMVLRYSKKSAVS